MIDKGELKLNNNPLKPAADGSFALDVGVTMKFTLDKDGKPVKADIFNADGSVTNLTAHVAVDADGSGDGGFRRHLVQR